MLQMFSALFWNLSNKIFRSPWTLRHNDWYIQNNVSEMFSASIVKEEQLQRVLCFTKISVNIGRHDMTSQKPGILFNTFLKSHKSCTFEKSEYLTGHL